MTTDRTKRARPIVCALCLAFAGCSDLYVMSKRVETTDGQRESAGVGCQMAFTGGSLRTEGGLTDFDRDFVYAEQERDGRFEVVVRSQGQELARRAYSEKFLLSGKRDTFTVTTLAGRSYELTYWGGDECDSSSVE